MLTFDARRLSGTLLTIEVEIIVTSTTGRNLHSVTVFGAISGSPPLLDLTLGCTSPFFRATIPGGVARDNLPILIRAFECDDANNPANPSVSNPLLGEERPQGTGTVICPPPGTTVQTMPPPPENQACREAQAEVQRLRNQIIENCGEIDRLTERRNASLAFAAIFFALAIAAAIASALIPIPFFRVLFIIAAAVFAAMGIAAAIAAAVYAGQIAAAEDRGRRLREDFQGRVASLPNLCCPEHIHVDTNEPRC